jgi:hypothetical protein
LTAARGRGKVAAMSRTTRGIAGLALALAWLACRPAPVEERREQLAQLCAEYCPLRVECVDDGWAKGEVSICTRMCVDEERYLFAGACGEASFALLECMATLTCAELPAAVAGLASSDEDSGCRAEQVAQRDECSFEIVR